LHSLLRAAARTVSGGSAKTGSALRKAKFATDRKLAPMEPMSPLIMEGLVYVLVHQVYPNQRTLEGDFVCFCHIIFEKVQKALIANLRLFPKQLRALWPLLVYSQP
jgi:hypothetical protein